MPDYIIIHSHKCLNPSVGQGIACLMAYSALIQSLNFARLRSKLYDQLSHEWDVICRVLRENDLKVPPMHILIY